MTLFRLISLLPLGVIHSLAIPLSFFVREILGYRRLRVRQNLRNAFPDKSIDELKVIRRDFYRNLVDVSLESIKASRMSKQELLSRVTLVNLQIFDAYAQHQQPVIIVGSHQANWEWIFLACSAALPFPLEGIYRPLHAKRLDEYMHDSRSRFGARMIPDRMALKDIMSTAGSMRAVSLIGDQHPPKKEPRYWTHFLNQDTAFFTGWAKLAQITKYPVIYADRERLERGRYQVTFRLIGEPPYPRNTGLLVEEFARKLETSIINEPCSWLWSHNRWREEKPLYS